jgi:hypothetical protein
MDTTSHRLTLLVLEIGLFLLLVLSFSSDVTPQGGLLTPVTSIPLGNTRLPRLVCVLPAGLRTCEGGRLVVLTFLCLYTQPSVGSS